jgi:predicted DNA-binding protein
MAMERISILLPVEVIEYLNNKARKVGKSLSDEVRGRVLANIEGLSEMEWDEAQCKWVDIGK